MKQPAAPRISVVVPAYNAETWLRATLNSVLAQTLPVHELIVVDDGSKDASADLVRRDFPQVRLLQQANAGVAAARNAGVAAASGDWIAFIDADDIWLPAKLERQWTALQAQPEAGIACSAWEVWWCEEPEPDPQLLARLADAPEDPARWGGPSGWIYADLLLDCQVWTSTVLVRKDLLEQAGPMDTGLRIGEDLDLWLRLSRLSPILRVAQPLALYRMHPSSITRGAPAQNYQGLVIERALQRWGYAGPGGSQADVATVNRALARTWVDFAAAQLQAGNRQAARSAAMTALRHDASSRGAWRTLLSSLLPRRVRSRQGS